MVYLCLSLVLVSLGLSLALSWQFARAGLLWGWVDRIGGEKHKLHRREVPHTGGLAIFWSVAGPMAAGLAAARWLPTSWWERWCPPMVEHLPGLGRVWAAGGAVLCAIAVIHLLGLYDDRRRLGAITKLLVQIVVALALVLICDMRVLDFLGQWYPWAGGISIIASVVWIVLIINAFNMLDNMDGLSAGVAAICAGLYLASTLLGGQWFVAAMCALLLGTLLGFLTFNFPPAKMFMGDSGSLVVGLLIAIISIGTTYFDSNDPDAPGNWYGILMPFMVLAIPLYDLVSVTLIRLARGRNPMVGDRRHFSHRLVRMGLSQRGAVMLIWLCTLGTGLSGVMLGSLEKWQAVLAATVTLCILLILAILELGSANGGKVPNELKIRN